MLLGFIYLGLFVFSVVFAIGAFLFGHDTDHDMGGGHDIGDGGMPSVFSGRVISLFLMGFSGMGLIASWAWHLNGGYSALCGLGVGVVLGLAAWLFILLFYREQASSMPQTDDYIGAEARVTANIPANGTGEISVVVRGQLKSIFATAADGSAIPEGRTVKVVSMAGGTATVTLVK